MKDQTQDKLKKIQLFAAVSLLLLSALFLFKTPGITGHFSADFLSQRLNIVVDRSQVFEIGTSNPEPAYISSVRLSGNVIGEGSVEVFIEKNSQEYLIYRNVKEKEQGLKTITGMTIAETDSEEEGILLSLTPITTIEWEGGLSLSETEEYVEGPFNNVCVDTCFIEMPVSSEEKYNLIFMIEPGTKVEINKITYTLKDEKI